ncbi:hypothetical protein TNCV_4398471 [Trichonephila clavipes]|nr:hypothetical protein TNCV_4398471 [Trichonephila clavipes]
MRAHGPERLKEILQLFPYDPACCARPQHLQRIARCQQRPGQLAASNCDERPLTIKTPPNQNSTKVRVQQMVTYILRSPDELDSTRGLLPSLLNFTLILVMSMLLTATRRNPSLEGENVLRREAKEVFGRGDRYSPR